MDIKKAAASFAALGQTTRIDVLRLLVKAGVDGLPAGELGRLLDVRQNTMSANLSVLLHAGLVRNVREGRTIRYIADYDGIGDLLAFLMEDCCGGRPELCEPIIENIVCLQGE